MSAPPAHTVLLDLLAPVSGRHEMAPPSPDRKPAPWESAMQATCECLSWRGALDNLARRHAEDELGETVYAEFPAHTRSALVTAQSLLDGGVITAAELRVKMREVRARLEKT